jgi:hypothetical protein
MEISRAAILAPSKSNNEPVTVYAVLGIRAHAPLSSGYDIQSIMKESTDFFLERNF